MSNRRCAEMYRAGTMRDREANTRSNPVYLTSKAVYVRCHVPAPPSLDEYDKWFADAVAEIDSRARAKITLTGKKIRRAVIATREGCSQVEAGRAVGVSAACLNRWLKMLPPELRP